MKKFYLLVLLFYLPVAAHAISGISGRHETQFTTQELNFFSRGLIGIQYLNGGSNPETGFDCSGLVHYVFRQVTGLALPRTAKGMSVVGEKITQDQLQPGDLVFFNTRRFPFSHVGIYLGDNLFIHAPSKGAEVEIARLTETYWRKAYNGARRLVNEQINRSPDLSLLGMTAHWIY